MERDPIDPAMRAAYESLPADLQQSVQAREQRGETALRAAYLRHRAMSNPHPNRAARRRAARQKGH